MTCAEALDVIADSLTSSADRRHFQIALVGFLDGRPYPADGLAVNAANTPNFARTDSGFHL